MSGKMRDIVRGSRQKVIDADNLVTVLQQLSTQMASQESAAAGNDNSHGRPMLYKVNPSCFM